MNDPTSNEKSALHGIAGRCFVKREGCVYLVAAPVGSRKATREYRIDQRMDEGGLRFVYVKVTGTVDLLDSEMLEIESDAEEKFHEDQQSAERDFRREFAGVDGDEELAS